MSFIRTIIAASFAALGFAVAASAQLTILNIPTAETQPKRTFSLEGDLITKPVRFVDGGYRSYGYRAVYGLDHKTDIGANFYLTHDDSGAAGELQFNAKRLVHRNEGRGTAASVGAIGFFPLRNDTPLRAHFLFYAVGSKELRRARGLRLTGGGYHVFRGGREFGTRTGAFVGAEQPIARRISFLADWTSGDNRFGYSAAGLSFTLTSRQYLTASYNFGNTGRGNNALSLYYGYTF
jgi:hypothetical protein